MISKQEMYEFASQIAGITESDLEVYKCGGKTRKKQFGGNMRHTPSKKQDTYVNGRRQVDPGNAPEYVPAAGNVGGKDWYTGKDGSMNKRNSDKSWTVTHQNGDTRTYPKNSPAVRNKRFENERKKAVGNDRMNSRITD